MHIRRRENREPNAVLICQHVLVVLVAQSCPPLCDHMDYTAHQAPLAMGFSRQEYWSGLSFPSPVPASRGIIKGFHRDWSCVLGSDF